MLPCALCADPHASPKLLGTALTLLGGLAGWLAQQDQALGEVLPAVLVALQSQDDKLARNAATTVYRWCQHASLATRLLDRHRAWVENVLLLHSLAGGVQQRRGARALCGSAAHTA